jgi:hypothetical protein
MFEANAAPSASTFDVFADDLHAGPVQGLDHFGQRLDYAPDVAFARFHTLNSRKRYPRYFGQLTLIDAEQRPCGSQLEGGDQLVFPRLLLRGRNFTAARRKARIGLNYIKKPAAIPA